MVAASRSYPPPPPAATSSSRGATSGARRGRGAIRAGPQADRCCARSARRRCARPAVQLARREFAARHPRQCRRHQARRLRSPMQIGRDGFALKFFAHGPARAARPLKARKGCSSPWAAPADARASELHHRQPANAARAAFSKAGRPRQGKMACASIASIRAWSRPSGTAAHPGRGGAHWRARSDDPRAPVPRDRDRASAPSRTSPT